MRTTFLILLLAASACRSDQVGPVAIEQVVEGAPVRVVQARGQLSTLVGLGNTPTKITDDDDKNAAAAIFEVRVESELPPGLEMASRTICRVGEWTIAQPLTWNGSLDGTAVGESKEFYAQFMPTAAAPHTPSACEFSSWYGSIGIREGTVRIEPTRVATACWTRDAIVEGECGTDVLPRVAADDAEPIAIPAVRGAVAPANRDGGYGLGFDYVVTVNERIASQSRIIGRVRCEVDGEIVERSANTMTMLDHLAPGESAAGHGFAFADRPFTTAPDRCTLELQHAIAPATPGIAIAAWCITADRTEPGACD